MRFRRNVRRAGPGSVGLHGLRGVVAVVALVGCGALLLIASVFWHTAGYEDRRLDNFLRNQVAAIRRQPLDLMIKGVNAQFTFDLNRLTYAAVLTPQGDRLAGDLARLPPGLAVDGEPHRVRAPWPGAAGVTDTAIRAIAVRLPEGDLLVVGRSEADLANLRHVVGRAMLLGLMPGCLLAIAIGTLQNLRTVRRIRETDAAVDRIVTGDLAERLPDAGSADAVDLLARAVNRMLREIERLVGEIQNIGDQIAHDLRTPLTRVRTRVEAAAAHAADRDALAAGVHDAILDLDQAMAMITAMLRIAQIDAANRRAAFGPVDLAAVLREAAELYAPLAEAKSIALVVETSAASVFADRDLLLEVFANLLDNAIKFTPAGGRVRLAQCARDRLCVVVEDSGPGIAPAQRDRVMRRFTQGERQRPDGRGVGLGLSIVAAILRLHAFALEMETTPAGFAVRVHMDAAAVDGAPP